MFLTPKPLKAGDFVNKWGTIGSGPGQFFNPFGIAFDLLENVYVADQGNQRIQKFASDGTFLMQWGSGFNPAYVATDSANNVYATEQFDHRIAKFHQRWHVHKKMEYSRPISKGYSPRFIS